MADPDPNSPADLPAGKALSQRLKEQHGSGLDPTLSLEVEPEPDAPLSSAIHQKLSEQAPRGMRYKLLGEVARGGMGAILKIWDDELRRTLAMKVVLGSDAPSGGGTPVVEPRLLERFLEEAQVTGQLDHPGIVPVHELGLGEEGRVYFTMRLVKGEDLSKVYARVREAEAGWTQLRALGVVLKVCEAMSYAHSKKVLHRDLKPANVMVGKFGEVYVMDWGLARVLGRADKHDLRLQSAPPTSFSAVKTDRREAHGGDPDSPIVTMDGDIVGTPSFMPPEQARGELDQLGPHSDVYAIGAMLYTLVAGTMPYVPSGARVSARTILVSALNGPPRPLFELAPGTPAELLAIVEKAMAREISGRYATMQDLAEDLRAYIEGRVVRAYETGAWAEAKKWVKRNKPLAAALAAAVLAVATGGVVVAFKNAQLETTNLALDESRLEAVANADEAVRNAEQAARSERAAQAARLEAEQKTNDVLSLSAQKDLDDLVARADKLWPAHPEMIAEYEQWLDEARALIDGRPADDARGLKGRPSLAEHKSKLAELRSQAKPITAEQAQSEREAHPKYAELQTKQTELTWHSRMLSLEPWPSETQVEAELADESLPGDANGLNTLAWALVDPEKPVYGSEVRALLLARRAVAAASDAERGGIRDSLAWALFRLGRFDEALSEEDKAVAESPAGSLDASAAQLAKAVASWRGEELTARRARREALASEVAALEQAVSERQMYDYDDPEARWWDAQLSKLVTSLEGLRDAKTGLMSDAVVEPFGWGVAKRYEFALGIVDRSIAGPDARRLWSEATLGVKTSPKYGGLDLPPQLGLLPIGMDADSGLWEFAHLQTGDPAVRGADGRLALTEATGLVFVLIPEGTFLMGAQKQAPAGRNYDPQAANNESPVHEVELSAYFLSKYEMTQGQWQRIAARNPSQYGPWRYSTSWNRANQGWSALHPVEQVTWTGCMAMMERLSLELPSEAQWENGARAGTSTVYWTGDDLASMADAANLSDTYGKSHGNESWSVWEKDFDDGNTVHARVGSYRANAFGLHDVHGNVWEWCLDGDGNYTAGKQRDPTGAGFGASSRVSRGGGFTDAASSARSANRDVNTPESQSSSLGLRPARALLLSTSPLHPAAK